jgi:serine/threonine protein kinase
MKNVDIDFTGLDPDNIFKVKDGMVYLVMDGKFCKLINPKNIDLPEYCERLKSLELKLSDLEKNNLREIEEASIPTVKFYYKSKLVGYATEFLDNYGELIEVAASFDADRKLDLLIMLSRGVKKIHEHNFVHTDIYNGNVLTDGYNIKVIDFDEGHSYKEGEEVSYFDSPESDVAQVNDLFTRLLISDNKIITSTGGHIEIPAQVKKYLCKYDINSLEHFEQTVKSSIPEEYPHDWLESLRDYINLGDATAKEKTI